MIRRRYVVISHVNNQTTAILPSLDDTTNVCHDLHLQIQHLDNHTILPNPMALPDHHPVSNPKLDMIEWLPSTWLVLLFSCVESF
jgi:hypothetical protein